MVTIEPKLATGSECPKPHFCTEFGLMMIILGGTGRENRYLELNLCSYMLILQ